MENGKINKSIKDENGDIWITPSGIDKGNLTRAEMAALLYKISTFTPVSSYPNLPTDPVTPQQPAVPETPAAPEQPQQPAAPAQNILPIDALPAGAALGSVSAEPSLNVRSGPGTSYEVQVKLATGGLVLILETSEGWCHILYRGEDGAYASGYASADYINVLEGSGSVSAEPTLNVRSGPGTSHEVLAKLPTGTCVIVAEKLDGWIRLRFLNEGTLTEGYASADYITIAE